MLMIAIFFFITRYIKVIQIIDIESFFFSTGDVVSDFFVSGEYLNHDEDITSSGTRMINMWGDCVTDMITFRCWNRNTYNGMLTIVFIYLPASFTNAAVLGSRTAGWCSFTWGAIILIVGGVLIAVMDESVVILVGLFSGLLGLPTCILGFVLIAHQRSQNETAQEQCRSGCGSFFLKFLFYPILFMFSPLIFLYIKFLAIIKRDSKIIDNQKKIFTTAEAILEASPQYWLQMYIILHTLDPSTFQWISISTSLLSLSYPHIENFYGPQFSFVKDVFKISTLVIFLNTVGKILSLSILSVFFQGTAFYIIGCYWVVLFCLLLSTLPLCCLSKEEDKWKQLLEASTLGFIRKGSVSKSKRKAKK